MNLLSKYWAYFNNISGMKSRQIQESGFTTNYENSIWVLGCSHIHGTGNKSNETVVSNLTKLSNQTVINFGYPGSGPMMVEYRLKKLLQYYTPNSIVIAWPNFNRWQSIEKNFPDPVMWMPFCLDSKKRHNDHFGSKNIWPESYKKYKQMLLDDTVKDVNLKSYNNVHEMTKDITLVEFQYDIDEHLDIIKPCWPWKDLGSDNLHPGPETHSIIADWIWKQLNDV